MAEESISVVMGVRNGADTLAATIDSLLVQEGVDFEILVVDDGSTDTTAELLAGFAARDPRIRVLTRPARGLTRSLIEGCEAARGRFIARQDAGDRSVPGRLRKQLDCLLADREAVLCSTHVRLVVPEGSTIFVNALEARDLEDGLTGPAYHGSVLMRRDAYQRAGGYRAAFHYAQDIDLWSRMVELGRHVVVPEVLYEATFSPGSISGTRRTEQDRFHSFIVGATRARRSGLDEAPWLARAEAYSRQCLRSRGSARKTARGAYFIGSTMAAKDPTLARTYLRQALDLDPWHLRARLKLARLR